MRQVVKLLSDAVVWLLAGLIASVLTNQQISSTVFLAAVALLIDIPLGLVSGLYRRHWFYASLDEMPALIAGGVIAALIPVLIPGKHTSNGAVVVTGCLWLLIVGSLRVGVRFKRRHRGRESGGESVLIVGAGPLGRAVVTAMLDEVTSPFRPVGFLDDADAKRMFRFRGVAVVGNSSQLDQVAQKLNVKTVVVSIAHPSRELMERLTDHANATKLRLLVTPGLATPNSITTNALRKIDPLDLLGREEVEVSNDQIRDLLSGVRVLVTGAGGSIGSELSRQIYSYKPQHLYLLDRDESALHALALSISAKPSIEDATLVLADIRDEDRIKEVFTDAMPTVVFHAAALKHVTFLERYPLEGFKTNVIGTYNVLEASKAQAVKCFVNISTDKAANPENVLGLTKRIGERMTSAYAASTNKPFLSVRFGNVLGTRGSVLDVFASQLENNQPLTVSGPEVTRFFMTVSEAVQLVLQAAAVGRPGEALVLDMGAPVKILDLAERLIGQNGGTNSVVFTGLASGEKLHEELFSDGEEDEHPFHPRVSHVTVPPLEPEQAVKLIPSDRSASEAMAEIAKFNG